MQTAVEIESQLRARADEDEAFRTRLHENPRSAIKDVTGLDVPEAFSIHVHEESTTDFHLVLPPAGGRVSDQELREAAGGFAPGGDSW
ncbi:MAG: NHLP leader peptide family natural product precursor [Rhodospirillaceae bacterium]|nr:NHLP leader peptide family natural product precursor [Rhodospirillaceae bacterium]